MKALCAGSDCLLLSESMTTSVKRKAVSVLYERLNTAFSRLDTPNALNSTGGLGSPWATIRRPFRVH